MLAKYEFECKQTDGVLKRSQIEFEKPLTRYGTLDIKEVHKQVEAHAASLGRLIWYRPSPHIKRPLRMP